MAKFYGQKSRYLVRMITISITFGSAYILIGLCLFWVLFVNNIEKLTDLIYIITLIIISAPFFWWIYYVYKKMDRDLLTHAMGMRGENMVAQKLQEGLSNEYSVYSDVLINPLWGNIDFVVLGPTGLYTIEVKNYEGRVIEYNGKNLTHNGKVFRRNPIKQSKKQALKLHDLIQNKLNVDIFVKPVLVFANRTKINFGLNPVDDTFVIQMSWLKKLFEFQPPQEFPIDDRRRIEAVLEGLVNDRDNLIYNHEYKVEFSDTKYIGYNCEFDVSETYSVFDFLLKNKFWIGKISKLLKFVKRVELYDLDTRARIAYHLAKLLKVPMPKVKIIPQRVIKNFNDIFIQYPVLLLQKEDYYDFKNILLSEYRGKILVQDDYKKINIDDVWKIFIFDCWIGNLDKKDEDYLIDEENKLWTIDYQLWGVCDETNTSLGVYARQYEVNEGRFDLCIGKNLKSLLLSQEKINYSFIKEIEKLSDKKIKKIVNKYRLYRRGTQDDVINDFMIRYLIERKSQLRQQIEKYIISQKAQIEVSRQK